MKNYSCNFNFDRNKKRCKVNKGLWMGLFMAATREDDYGWGHFQAATIRMIMFEVIFWPQL